MTAEDWFAADVREDFEESIRVDRAADDGRDPRLRAIDTYHVTSEAGTFVHDFLARLLGRSEDMRTGSNYWLYGYYGSGKSHLLSVLDGLLDSQWLDDQATDVWDALTDGRDLADLRAEWQSVHEDYVVVPIPVNLLRYQGQKEHSFSEIVLRKAHQSEALTGVDGGFSSQLDVAYFEDWYRTTDGWAERDARVQEVLEGFVDDPSDYEWADVQQYGALAEVVLPRLFERETGTADGLDDLMPSDLDPAAMVSRVEELRSEREAELGRPVKLVLLLDEVSLFIGTDFDRLTELQTLAESVDEIGGGDIQVVATAQETIEDVQPRFAARGADFSIVKDRFPHRYALPSRHVGEISHQRLLKKSAAGADAVRSVLEDVDVRPEDSFVYSDVEQRTEPPLDRVETDRVVEFYPFLPYQPMLFLELLSNLRWEASDPAKSVFSGTARAILAIMHGLLGEWLDGGRPNRLVSMVDLYDLIEPELRDITSDDVEVLDEIKDASDEGELEDVDVRVAKAVLLLQHVPDHVPMTERNLAVAVMDDLDGPTQFQMETRVENSLERLAKYVRPSRQESEPRLRFATHVEREIYEEVERNEGSPDWDGVLTALDEHLWEDVVEELPLPDSVEFRDTGEQHKVQYSFEVDGQDFDTGTDEEHALDVHVAVEGVAPEGEEFDYDGEPLVWTVGDNGLTDLRDRLVTWWALQDAASGYTVPDDVAADLSDRAARARSGLVGALREGSFAVKDRTDIRGTGAAVEEFVAVRYPEDFHPMMLQVDEQHLHELRELTAEDPLPEWARKIQVATGEREGGERTILSNVRSHTGRQLQDRDGSLAMETLLDGVVERASHYEGTRPALCAILWGLCRQGEFLPVDESGDSLPLDSVLDLDSLATTRLEIAPRGPDLSSLLREGGFRETTETVADGLVNLQAANRSLADQLRSLSEDVGLVADNDVNTRPVGGLLEAFQSAIDEQEAAARERREAVRDGDTDWESVIEETTDAQAWAEDVRDVWGDRLSALLRLDALLTVTQQPFDWLTEDCETAATELRDALNGYGGAWWTHDGWDAFNDATAVTPAIDDAVAEAWTDFEGASGIASLVADLEASPWVRPPNELPSWVRPGFESEYVTPLERARSWYETVSEAVETIVDEPTTTDADEYVTATDAVVDAGTLESEAGQDVAALTATYETMDDVVGDRTPDDVVAVGVVPSDREFIESELERAVEERDLTVEATEAGLVIQ